MIAKRDALKEAKKRFGDGAFLLTRHTMDAPWRKAIGVRLPDSTIVELGRGRNWEVALEAASASVAESIRLAQKGSRDAP